MIVILVTQALGSIIRETKQKIIGRGTAKPAQGFGNLAPGPNICVPCRVAISDTYPEAAAKPAPCIPAEINPARSLSTPLISITKLKHADHNTYICQVDHSASPWIHESKSFTRIT